MASFELSNLRPVVPTYVLEQLQSYRLDSYVGTKATAVDPETGRYLAIGLNQAALDDLINRQNISEEQINRFIQLFEAGREVKSASLAGDINNSMLVFFPSQEAVDSIKLEAEDFVENGLIYLLRLPSEESLIEDDDNQLHSEIVTDEDGAILNLSAKEAQNLFVSLNSSNDYESVTKAYGDMMEQIKANKTLENGVPLGNVSAADEFEDEEEEDGLDDDGLDINTKAESIVAQSNVDDVEAESASNITVEVESSASPVHTDTVVVDPQFAQALDDLSVGRFKPIEARYGESNDYISVVNQTRQQANARLLLMEKQLKSQLLMTYRAKRSSILAEYQAKIDPQTGDAKVQGAYQQIMSAYEAEKQIVAGRVDKKRDELNDGLASQRKAYMDAAVARLASQFEAIKDTTFIEKPLSDYEMTQLEMVETRQAARMAKFDAWRQSWLDEASNVVTASVNESMLNQVERASVEMRQLFSELSHDIERQTDRLYQQEVQRQIAQQRTNETEQAVADALAKAGVGYTAQPYAVQQDPEPTYESAYEPDYVVDDVDESVYADEDDYELETVEESPKQYVEEQDDDSEYNEAEFEDYDLEDDSASDEVKPDEDVDDDFDDEYDDDFYEDDEEEAESSNDKKTLSKFALPKFGKNKSSKEPVKDEASLDEEDADEPEVDKKPKKKHTVKKIITAVAAVLLLGDK